MDADIFSTDFNAGAPIFLVGFMGCGKTTLGRALAKSTGRMFVDLDFYIEQRFRRSVAQIFAEKGEAEFRRLESELLREVGEFRDVVVSCGGGTPCHDDNMEYMNSRGLTVWLRASDECLFRRLTVRREKRPLLAGRTDDEVRQIISERQEERRPHYSKARMTFSSDDLESATQIARSVESLLSQIQ